MQVHRPIVCRIKKKFLKSAALIFPITAFTFTLHFNLFGIILLYFYYIITRNSALFSWSTAGVRIFLTAILGIIES